MGTDRSTPLLQVNDLQVYYGAIYAIRGITFVVNEGEIVSLIGANGAGKTTTLRALSGLIPSTGKMEFCGKDLRKIPTHQRVGRGLAQSPEGRGVFPGLTVRENIEMGAYCRRDVAQIASDMEECYQLFPKLRDRRAQLAGTLSGGEQQMLAISRALMAKPRLLLLDEPSLGLAPLIVAQIFEIIQRVNKKGVTILLVEQNARMALKQSHRAYVLETGRIVLEGMGHDLLENDQVRRSYLGV
ncbi:MAG: ABC transporter ATP-binding protein [Bdellovibrio sp.]|nr:MAG: ABC transporter ATP-binding protein [Bdellovibrio sp.]